MTERLTDHDLRILAGLDVTPESSVDRRDLVVVATELLLLRARCAYVLAHGSAWEQRVMRGELDHEALGTPPAPTPPGPAPSPNG